MAPAMDERWVLGCSLDDFRPLLEGAAAETGVVLDFLMRRWNGRFATFNVGLPTEAVTDLRRGVCDEARHYRLLGRVKATTRADGLHLSLYPPTACDLAPTPDEQAQWGRFAATLARQVAGSALSPARAMSSVPALPRSTVFPPLLVLVGPTAVGKTETSLRLARRFGGEIVSADSRQFYRGMDIGTAKATPEERAAVPHHLLDVCEPTETLTLADFQERAYALVADIAARGRLPMLVGGTGLYVRAVVEGYGIPRVPPDDALRGRLFAIAEEQGYEALHQRLAGVDPEAAAAIDARNVRRVVRALEVFEKSGVPISVHQRRTPPPYRILQLGLTRPREQLYQRVDRRIQAMLDAGLVAEVQRLLDAGVPPDSEPMSGLGYRETVAFLHGELPSEEELAAAIGRNTRRFIRAQANWFRANDPSIRWFDLDQVPYEQIEALVSEWLRAGEL